MSQRGASGFCDIHFLSIASGVRRDASHRFHIAHHAHIAAACLVLAQTTLRTGFRPSALAIRDPRAHRRRTLIKCHEPRRIAQTRLFARVSFNTGRTLRSAASPVRFLPLPFDTTEALGPGTLK